MASNAFLLGHWFYNLAFGLQALFYLSAFVGLAGDRYGIKLRPLAIPLYFCVVNAASMVAFWKTLKGQKMVTWETVRK